MIFTEKFKAGKGIPILIKSIAIIEILGGCFGVGLSILNLLFNPRMTAVSVVWIPISCILFMASFLFVIYAGYKLWKNSLIGVELSMLAQVMQLVLAKGAIISYELFGGIAFYLFYTNEGFKRTLSLGGGELFSIGSASFESFGINLVALFFLISLVYYYHSLTNKHSIVYRTINKIIKGFNPFWIKAIALIEVVGGIVGIFSVVKDFIVMEHESLVSKNVFIIPSTSFIYFSLFCLITFAGYKLWKNSISGYNLSLVAQVIQIPYFFNSVFRYEFVTSIGLFYGTDGLETSWNIVPGNEYHIRPIIGSFDQTAIAVNLIPIIFLLILIFYRKKLKSA